MNDSKRVDPGRKFEEDRKKILDYLKFGPAKGKSEIAALKNLSEALEIDVVEIEKIIASLTKERLVTKSTFTSYSPITRTSETGFAISPHYPKPSKPRLPKTLGAGSSAKAPQFRTKTEKPPPLLKEARRINGRVTKSTGDYIPRAQKKKKKKRAQDARRAALLGADRAGTW